MRARLARIVVTRRDPPVAAHVDAVQQRAADDAVVQHGDAALRTPAFDAAAERERERVADDQDALQLPRRDGRRGAVGAAGGDRGGVRRRELAARLAQHRSRGHFGRERRRERGCSRTHEQGGRGDDRGRARDRDPRCAPGDPAAVADRLLDEDVREDREGDRRGHARGRQGERTEAGTRVRHPDEHRPVVDVHAVADLPEALDRLVRAQRSHRPGFARGEHDDRVGQRDHQEDAAEEVRVGDGREERRDRHGEQQHRPDRCDHPRLPTGEDASAHHHCEERTDQELERARVGAVVRPVDALAHDEEAVDARREGHHAERERDEPLAPLRERRGTATTSGARTK